MHIYESDQVPFCISRDSLNIAPDKAPFYRKVPIFFFFYFSTKSYVVGTHLKHFTEALLMRTHNIRFFFVFFWKEVGVGVGVVRCGKGQRCHVSLCHWGVQLILAYSWARPTILVAVKGRGGMFLFLLFLHFHSYFSFFTFSLSSPLLFLLSLFSLSLGDSTKWPTKVDVSLNPNMINKSSVFLLKNKKIVSWYPLISRAIIMRQWRPWSDWVNAILMLQSPIFSWYSLY